MNGTAAALAELETLAALSTSDKTDVLICPPATLISRAKDVAGSVAIGGQDCHANANGASLEPPGLKAV